MERHQKASKQHSFRAKNRELVAQAWSEFGARFPTTKSCLDELYQRMGVSTEICSFCQSRQVELRNNHRQIKCMNCKRTKWLTADTFFEGIKEPRAWLGAIWLFEQGLVFSAKQFHELTELGFSSAYDILRYLGKVIEEHMTEDSSNVASTLFRGLFLRRSRETPKRRHPRDDESVFCDNCGEPSPQTSYYTHGQEKEDDARGFLNRLESASNAPRVLTQNASNSLPTTTAPGFQLDEQQLKTMEHLSQTPTSVDVLCERTNISEQEMISILTTLELFNLATSSDGRFRRTKASMHDQNNEEPDKDTNALITKAILILRSVFNGISQKYLQNYLSRFWCLSDRARWQDTTLSTACIQSRRMTRHEYDILASPKRVRIMRC